jgi:hypothetical protein
MDLPNAADGHVFLEYTYIRFKSGKIMRWCNSRAMRAIAELNDRGGRVELIREFQRMLKSGNAVVARLNPPIGVRSQSHLRSEAHKEMKRKSAEKSQHKRKNGIPPRKYTSPIARGLRQGNGLAHTWDE